MKLIIVANVIARLRKLITASAQEWWIGATGDIVEADNDSNDGAGTYGHEDRAIEEAQKYVRAAMEDHPVFSGATGIFGEEGNYDSYDPIGSREYLANWTDSAFNEGLITEEDVDNIYEAIVRETGVSMALLDIAVGSSEDFEARDYAMKEWKWIAVRGTDIEMQTLDMDRLARGLYSIYLDKVDYLKFDINVRANKKYFTNVPYQDILDENLAIHGRDNSAFAYAPSRGM